MKIHAKEMKELPVGRWLLTNPGVLSAHTVARPVAVVECEAARLQTLLGMAKRLADYCRMWIETESIPDDHMIAVAYHDYMEIYTSLIGED